MPIGFVVTGFPAFLIIATLLWIFALGLRSAIGRTVRGVRRVMHFGDRNDD